VAAVVILRDVSGQGNEAVLYRTLCNPICDFEVLDEQGSKLQLPQGVRVWQTSQLLQHGPHTQYRSWTALDKVVDLTRPGRYRVRGVAPVPVRDAQTGAFLHFTNVLSGYAQFAIEAGVSH
jgi:hypothetical protein